MSHKPHRCDACGESDRVRTVVLQIHGEKAWRRRLCIDCQNIALVAITTAGIARRR